MRVVESEMSRAAGRLKNLLENGAHVNAADEYGYTALHYASEHGHIKIVTLFVKAKADINVQNIYGETALVLAIRNRHTKIVDVLIKAGADPNLNGKSGRNALHEAAYEQNFPSEEIISLLIETGVNVNAQTQTQETALQIYIAVQRNWRHIKIVSRLIAAGSDVNLQNQKGQTALHLHLDSPWCHYVKVVSILIDAGYEVNLQNKAGDTALHIASRTAQSNHSVEKDQLQIVSMLLGHGGNIFVKNANGKTPFEEAASHVLSLFRSQIQTLVKTSLPEAWNVQTETIGNIIVSFLVG